MKNLPQPTKAITRVLLSLITEPAISERQFSYNSFRDIISTLRRQYHVPIRHVDVEGQNEFGRRYIYRKHFLLTISREKAVRTYLKLNAN